MENNEENKSFVENSAKVNPQDHIQIIQVPDSVLSNSQSPKKKKVILIAVAVVIIVLLLSIFLIFKLGSKKKNSDTNTNSNKNINYQEILDSYAKRIEGAVSKYQSEHPGEPLPYQSIVSETSKVGHDINCATVGINSSGTIYLLECRIDQSKEQYSYGQKEEAKGLEVAIYQNKEDFGMLYGFTQEDNSTKVGSFRCETDDCEPLSAYKDYALVEEQNTVAIYDYSHNQLVMRLNKSEFEDYEEIGSTEQLHGIVYRKGEKSSIYALETGKVVSDISGIHVDQNYMMMDNGIGWAWAKGYVLFVNDGKTNIYTMKDGSLAFTLEGKLLQVEEAPDKSIYYMIQAGETTSIVYNEAGKKMFNGEKVETFQAYDQNYITSLNNVFRVYDKSEKLLYSSPEYSTIMLIIKDYVVVREGAKIELVNYQGDVVHTFITDWNDNRYFFHTMLSGWYTENGKNGIYLVIQDSKVTIEDVMKNHTDLKKEELEGYDYGYEYYYIPTTKESGKIATYIGGYAKPILYLYPTRPMFVTVSFEHPEYLTTTYPKYQNSWKVFAQPNGDLYTLDKNYYYALYWEEKGNHFVDFKEGFYVTSENAIPFLEEKLTQIGLNARERNEFIMYWLPVLEKNQQSLVYFELTDERNTYSAIHISPKPDSILRLAIHIKKVDSYVPIREQKLPTFTRKGFTVVEWGGVTY